MGLKFGLSHTLRDEHRLRTLVNRMLRGMFRPKREEGQEAGEECITRSFITCTLHQILFRW
jgi:hypothetical protein